MLENWNTCDLSCTTDPCSRTTWRNSGGAKAKKFVTLPRLPPHSCRARLPRRAASIRAKQNLALDAHALPESDAVFDFGGGGLRFGVIPGRVVVANAVHFNMVIVGGTLPGTNRSVLAGFQGFLLDGFERAILVAFDNDGGAAFRDDFSAPGCFGHLRDPLVYCFKQLDARTAGSGSRKH